MRGFIGWPLADLALKFFPYSTTAKVAGGAYKSRSKLVSLFGPDVIREFAEKTVIDFGCGDGCEVCELARVARRVTGLEIRQNMIEAANARIRREGLANAVVARESDSKADIILSLDSFEHFADPAATLQTMASLLNPGGYVLASFGPPWGHPYGGHMFSRFYWAHLIFTERSLMRWRSQYANNSPARRYLEMPEPLNRMTIHRFKTLVSASPLAFASFRAIPIKTLRFFHNRLTDEFFTSVVQCRLVLRNK